MTPALPPWSFRDEGIRTAPRVLTLLPLSFGWEAFASR